MFIYPLTIYAQKTCHSLFQDEPASRLSNFEALDNMEKLIAIEEELHAVAQLAAKYQSEKTADPVGSEEISSQMIANMTSFEALADHLLNQEKGDYQTPMQNLMREMERTKKYILFLKKRYEVTNIVDLIEDPTLILNNKAYHVPQADSISGKPSQAKMTVSFSAETAEFIRSEPSGGARFLRAIQKGYVPSGSGSGMVRITDQHENLLEVKTIGGREGNTRLIGCKGASGAITILKVYEKRNEGSGGSLKKFSLLCG